ncbi:MAG: hypothetical protein VKJ09_13990 [Leptolyngbya sp.]|nr:hypothetical protein [Leptolyngbya sp.]
MLAALSGNVLFPLFSLPFWAVGIGLAITAGYSAGCRTQLAGRGDRFTLRRLFLRWEKIRAGALSDLDGVELRTAYTQNHHPVNVITLIAGAETYKFGTMLSPAEKDWLAAELEDYILDLPAR